jgi:hypothetical protein
MNPHNTHATDADRKLAAKISYDMGVAYAAAEEQGKDAGSAAERELANSFPLVRSSQSQSTPPETPYPRRWSSISQATFPHCDYALVLSPKGPVISCWNNGHVEESVEDEASFENLARAYGWEEIATPDHADHIKRLAAAAEEAVRDLEQHKSMMKSEYRTDYQPTIDALTAALNALPPELRGTT